MKCVLGLKLGESVKSKKLIKPPEEMGPKSKSPEYHFISFFSSTEFTEEYMRVCGFPKKYVEELVEKYPNAVYDLKRGLVFPIAFGGENYKCNGFFKEDPLDEIIANVGGILEVSKITQKHLNKIKGECKGCPYNP